MLTDHRAKVAGSNPGRYTTYQPCFLASTLAYLVRNHTVNLIEIMINANLAHMTSAVFVNNDQLLS